MDSQIKMSWEIGSWDCLWSLSGAEGGDQNYYRPKHGTLVLRMGTPF